MNSKETGVNNVKYEGLANSLVLLPTNFFIMCVK